MIGFDWNDVLPPRVEPSVREELTRVLDRLDAEARKAEERARAALDSVGMDADLEARLWVAFHALGGRVPVACGSRLGLVLRAATRGDRESRSLAQRIVARSQAMLRGARRRPTAVVTDSFCAVRLADGRCVVASIADESAALPALAALRALAELEDR